MNPLIEVVVASLSWKQIPQCLEALEVVDILLEIRGNEVIGNESLKRALLDTLKEDSDEVVELALKVLVKYVEHSHNLQSLIDNVIEVFSYIGLHV